MTPAVLSAASVSSSPGRSAAREATAALAASTPSACSDPPQAVPADVEEDPRRPQSPAGGGHLAAWEGEPRPGTITLAATPIGCVADASPRLRHYLQAADVVAAEDTRRLLNLAARLGVSVDGRVMSFHEHNERTRADELVAQAREGRSVLVVSDAGMPSVSDPGYRLVRCAAQAGVAVTVLPGPSAVLTALVLSGLATDRFCFEGFLPRKDGERRRALLELADQPRTMVFFESPRRLASTLETMAEILGHDRAAAVCREMTKVFEDVWRGSLGDLARRAAQGVRGEVVLVVAGAQRAETACDAGAAARQAVALAQEGMRLKAAAAHAARSAGLRPNEVYRAALTLREGGGAH